MQKVNITNYEFTLACLFLRFSKGHFSMPNQAANNSKFKIENGILSAFLHEHDDRSIDRYAYLNELSSTIRPLLNLSNGNLVMGFRFVTVDHTLLVLCIFNV